MPKLPSGKAQFSLYVEAGLKKRFDDICADKGYKKQTHLEKMLRAWIEKEEGARERREDDQKPLKLYPKEVLPAPPIRASRKVKKSAAQDATQQASGDAK